MKKRKKGNDSNKETVLALTLSGGGSRAIAFHLGAMKEYQNHGILDRVNTISTVSGGSVIGALYVYNDFDFPEFEKFIKQLLKKGLVGKIATSYFKSLNCILGLPNSILSSATEISNKLLEGHTSLMRYYSRTEAFRLALDRYYFKRMNIRSPTRNDVRIIINGAEMKTGTSFRFSNQLSYCWRYGRIKDNNVSIADAVACSAAYPGFLPSLFRSYPFIKDDGEQKFQKVILSDGGIYENLGVSAVAPGKNPKISPLAMKPDYILCSDASFGQFEEMDQPIAFPSRMIKCFEILMKKQQDNTLKMLHNMKDQKNIKGFVLSYLGQIDGRLKRALKLEEYPDDYVYRNEVDYPTDFSPMDDSDIDKLMNRGQVLTRLLLKKYCPELISNE